jgi:hypothetical protein
MRENQGHSPEELFTTLARERNESIRQALEARELVANRTVVGADDPIAGLKAALDEVDPNWRLKPIFVSLFSGNTLLEIVTQQVDFWARYPGGELRYRCRVDGKWVETDNRDRAIESVLVQIQEVAEKYNLKPRL